MHCYSSSGPDVDESLPLELLETAVRDAATLGYRALAVSGGEPLLYRPLLALLDAAHAHGLLATVSTNAMALTAHGAGALVGRADLVAVSVDGPEAGHDRMRAHDGAFAGMVRGMAHLRSAGVPFGIIFTLTQYNVVDLPWLAEFAAEQGAVLLQIHPLDGQGRALEALAAGERPDGIELAVAAALVPELQRATAGLVVQLDAVERDAVAHHPARFQGTGRVGSARLGEWLQPLVIRSDGEVVPLAHDFPATLGLGSLHRAGLAELAAAWHGGGGAEAFAQVCRRAFLRLTSEDGPALSYWYEALTASVRADLGATTGPA